MPRRLLAPLLALLVSLGALNLAACGGGEEELEPNKPEEAAVDYYKILSLGNLDGAHAFVYVPKEERENQELIDKQKARLKLLFEAIRQRTEPERGIKEIIAQGANKVEPPAEPAPAAGEDGQARDGGEAAEGESGDGEGEKPAPPERIEVVLRVRVNTGSTYNDSVRLIKDGNRWKVEL